VPVGATTVQRSALIRASLPEVWALLCDPHHQPRWWPGVERIESVEPARFTQVLRTRRGRPVRVDYTVAAAQPPAWLEWRQELQGSPFARVLSSSEIRIALTAETEATRVTISQRQQLRGSNRTGGWMLSRATRRRLDAALAGLAAVL
jgi:uncharacterized protein YndB with AHSA1/START domain